MNERIHQIEQIWQTCYRQVALHYREQNHPLGEAISYVLAKPGKQLRPMLCLLCCDALSSAPHTALPPAIACELIHTYSLIHDDLPAMDNATTRRGQATLHVTHNEATAILAGDALLTDAFGWIAGSWGVDYGLSPQQKMEMIGALSALTGSEGMVLGQIYDIHHPPAAMAHTSHSVLTALPEELKAYGTTNLLKTGALFAAALMMGAMAAGCGRQSPTVQALETAGFELGISFQIADDLCDEASSHGSHEQLRTLATTLKNRGCQRFTEIHHDEKTELKSLLWYIKTGFS